MIATAIISVVASCLVMRSRKRRSVLSEKGDATIRRRSPKQLLLGRGVSSFYSVASARQTREPSTFFNRPYPYDEKGSLPPLPPRAHPAYARDVNGQSWAGDPATPGRNPLASHPVSVYQMQQNGDADDGSDGNPQVELARQESTSKDPRVQVVRVPSQRSTANLPPPLPIGPVPRTARRSENVRSYRTGDDNPFN